MLPLKWSSIIYIHYLLWFFERFEILKSDSIVNEKNEKLNTIEISRILSSNHLLNDNELKNLANAESFILNDIEIEKLEFNSKDIPNRMNVGRSKNIKNMLNHIDILSETNALITRDTIDNQMSSIMISTSTMATTTNEPCFISSNNNFTIVDRQWNSFYLSINYECSFDPETFLDATYDFNPKNSCSIKSNHSLKILNIYCSNIFNSSGRNIQFNLTSKESEGSGQESLFVDFTLSLTLKPILFNETSITNNISTVFDVDSIHFTFPQCSLISDPSFLSIQLINGNRTERNVSLWAIDDCQVRFDDLLPGSIYEIQIRRAPIRIIDTLNDTFPEDIFKYQQQIRTSLSKVDNITVEYNESDLNQSIQIFYKVPSGFFDYIVLNCLANDDNCSNRTNVMINKAYNQSSSTNSSFNLTGSIRRGVNYSCRIITSRESFVNVSSNDFTVKTNLLPIIITSTIESNRTNFSINFTEQSDFGSVRLFCVFLSTASRRRIMNDLSRLTVSNICPNLTIISHSCSRELQFPSVNFGCQYRCTVEILKENYPSISMSPVMLNIMPIAPELTILSQGSRWIDIRWNFSRQTWAPNFTLHWAVNQSMRINGSLRSFNLTTGIQPYRNYSLSLELNSFKNVLSNVISIRTNPDVPPEPDSNVINNSIEFSTDDITSKLNQVRMNINVSLFSNVNGPIQRYLFYMRQNESSIEHQPISPGTYKESKINSSIDYLALVWIVNQTLKYSKQDDTNNGDQKLSIILGNQINCSNESISEKSCNGPLAQARTYRVLLGACTSLSNGNQCRYVVSKSFTTGADIDGSSSKAWVAIFPIFAVLALLFVGVFLWKKRETLPPWLNRTGKRSISSSSMPSVPVSSPSLYMIQSMRPKPLSKFINMTDQDQQLICDEFKDLEKLSNNRDRYSIDADSSHLDRYANITARGPWSQTAVILNEEHRSYDYINANKIRGVNSNQEYIACQGPLESTAADFWDMIVQYRVQRIVMLTKIEERKGDGLSTTVAKCYKYFPNDKDQRLTFGENTIIVHDIKYIENIHLEIRRIHIERKSMTHDVIHYFYTGWPDFGIVHEDQLIALMNEISKEKPFLTCSVHTSRSREPPPIVIHCSAGVGRTGTYIGVDIVRNLINKTATEQLTSMTIDVMGIVYCMRKDRGKMVQNKDQYLLISRCVGAYLKYLDKLSLFQMDDAVTYENVQNDIRAVYVNESSLNKNPSVILTTANQQPSSKASERARSFSTVSSIRSRRDSHFKSKHSNERNFNTITQKIFNNSQTNPDNRFSIRSRQYKP